MLILLPLAVAALGLPVLFLAFRAFNALIALERTRHPAVWERDGRPEPLLTWFGRTSLRSWIATQRCSVVWVFKTPSWAKADPEALLQLRRLRLFVGIWNLGVMPVYVAMLYIAITRSAD